MFCKIRVAFALAALFLAGFGLLPEDIRAAGPSDIIAGSTIDWAGEKLDQAEAALANGNLAEAYRLQEEAADAGTEFHGKGLAVVGPRSLGDDFYGRLFDFRYRLYTEMGKKAEAAGLTYRSPGGQRDRRIDWDSRSAVDWYWRALNADELLRLVNAAPDDLRILQSFKWGGTYADVDDIQLGEPAFEREPIAREQALRQRIFDEVWPAVEKRIRSYAAALLEHEAREFSKPETEMETRVLTMESDMTGVAEAVTGAEAEEVAPRDIRLMLARVDDSMDTLKEAKRWLESFSVSCGENCTTGNKAVSVYEIALQRADALLAIGDDENMPLPTRNDALREAQEYYSIGEARDKIDMAYERQVALSPALEAYQAEREAQMEAAQERLQAEAAEYEQALKDMEKTEEEKEAFEEEADALEDELGF